MAIKYDIQGLLIYLTMALYLLAFMVTLGKFLKAGRIIFAVGFLMSIASVVYRSWSVQHIPMQNLFEVFLTLGMLIYPVYLFCRKFLGTQGDAFDMFTGLVVLFPAGFVFSDLPEHLPPALQSPLFAPHVIAYMLSYVIMAKAAYLALAGMYSPSGSADSKSAYEAMTYRMVKLGFPPLTAGLLLGSVWGKTAWGHYWNWDPKELWSLASWLVYVGYFHYRYAYPAEQTCRIRYIWVITGFVFVIITLIWVNLSHLFAGLHSYAF